MNKTKISAEVVADSVDVRGNRLTSLLITFPRIILAEINTHRMLSKNTSSSRAIPFNKMVESVKNDPFIPIAWQKEHTGMQGYEYITDEKNLRVIKEDWLEARDNAIYSATQLNNGFNLKDEEGKYVMTKPELRVDRVTKQLCNRLLEPFMWTTMLITGSKEGWDNFFKLRCPDYKPDFDRAGSYKSIKEMSSKTGGTNLFYTGLQGKMYADGMQISFVEALQSGLNKGQAEIHMMMLSEKIYDAMNESNPTQLLPGMYHIPFRKQINELYPDVENDSEDVVKISVSMAARTSYTVVGDEKEISKEKHIDLHDRLISQNPPHSSPLEHIAQVPTQYEYDMALKGEEKGWFYNLKGFKSYRYIIETQNE